MNDKLLNNEEIFKQRLLDAIKDEKNEDRKTTIIQLIEHGYLTEASGLILQLKATEIFEDIHLHLKQENKIDFIINCFIYGILALVLTGAFFLLR